MSQWLAAFAEFPFVAAENFAKREIIGGNVLLALREALFAGGKLVHEREPEFMFLRGKVDLYKAAGEVLGGFPADLPAQTGLVARGLNPGMLIEESVENGLEEMPIL